MSVHQPEAFLDAHAARVLQLEGPLRGAIGDGADWAMIRDPPIMPSPLVLTHGDPGPGNFLDDGVRGCVIDLETAQVSPLGLDLARVMFIALLGSGPEGFEARDHPARARAVAAAYLNALTPAWEPTRCELRAWLAVAAVQFAHHRHQRFGQPGVRPVQDVIVTLGDALRTDVWQPA